jgi:hypothetical protein
MHFLSRVLFIYEREMVLSLVHTKCGDGRGLFPALKKEGKFAVALHD